MKFRLTPFELTCRLEYVWRADQCSWKRHVQMMDRLARSAAGRRSSITELRVKYPAMWERVR